jgi:hypothetical protein
MTDGGGTPDAATGEKRLRQTQEAGGGQAMSETS